MQKMIKLTAEGMSMYPFFKPKDIIFIRPLSFSQIKIDNFVTFLKNNHVITHRVIYISHHKKYLISKGDTNYADDGKIYPKQILGIVKKIERDHQTFSVDMLYSLQSYLYLKELQKINTHFKKNKINFVFLKGLPLHLYLEKKIPSRLYADCDILIKKSDSQKAHNSLTALGFKRKDVSLSKIHTVLKNKETEIDYIKIINDIPITIDLHFEASIMIHQIGSLNALYPEELLTNFSEQLLFHKKCYVINKCDMPLISGSILIVYLATHLFHHNFTGYYRYELLKKLLKVNKVNIKEILEIIHTYHFEKFVYPVFYFLWKYYNNEQAKIIISGIKISQNEKRNIKKYIDKISIFSSDTRINEGKKRFWLLFILSPNSIIKKSVVFLYPPVLYSIIWVIIKNIKHTTRLVSYKYIFPIYR